MPQFEKLPPAFYDRPDVVRIARELLGQVLVTCLDGIYTAGRIVETEAYAGPADRASHAWNNRRTARTEVMFGAPGHAYVYICYGIHQLFNVITHKEGIPHAVLIRALEPVEGLHVMQRRTKKKAGDYSITRGPGNLAVAMGIQMLHNGLSLQSDELFIARGNKPRSSEIIKTVRIGVESSGEDALRPYRFILVNNPYVSGPKLPAL